MELPHIFLAVLRNFWGELYWSKKVTEISCKVTNFISRSSIPQGPIDHQVRSMKAGEAVDYMKMGLVKEVRRNGAVVHVKEEGEEKEQRFFIPGKASKIVLTNS